MPAKRWAGRATAGLVLVAALAALALANWDQTRTIDKLTLVYVGAENCAPCDVWQRQYEPRLRNSAEFHRLTYREVKSPSLFEVLNDRNWPEDLRLYRQAIGRGAGVPLWLVIADDQLIMQRSGLSQWNESVLPKVRSLLRYARMSS
ncbi:MAG TPA: hypothetical protein VFP60_08730 [Pseudolabrys sp.]|nr:hypothetical protein [Pseudolabrys sp.]